MLQLTQKDVKKIRETESWKKLNYLQVAGFQLYQNILFVDFEYFHDCLNKALLRGKGFEKEGIRFRLESSEKLQEDWEKLHNVPDFLHIYSILMD